MVIVEQVESPQLIVSGEVDLAAADELRAAGARALDALGSGPRLDIDMAGVSFIDSSGLGALVAIRNAAEASGRSIALLVTSAPIIRLFELTGLRDTFAASPGSD